MSQMCIDATRAAADFGFDVTVAEDACGAKEVSFGGTEVAAEQVHATIMGALDGTYAKVLKTDAYLAGNALRSRRDAKLDHFERPRSGSLVAAVRQRPSPPR